MNTKYLWLLLIFIGFTACNDEEDYVDPVVVEELPALTAGSANFSKFVSIGNSLTAGYTDNALFIAAQENSMPNLLSQKFALVGGGSFTQPLMNDNFGGLSLGGNRIADPRLVFDGSGPVPLESLIGTIAPTTDLAINNPTGPFNNMGVPGAASFHLLFDGYGNLGNLQAGLANPYFIRMASAPNATVLGDALAQSPTFVSLWIGSNDILGYATSGGTGTITPQPVFEGSINAIVGALQQANVQGVMANIPCVKSIPHFTTVPHNPIPLDADTASFLNSTNAYGAYNAGIQQAFAYLVSVNAVSQEDADAEIAKRTISFFAGQGNAVVIMDEDLTDLTGINPALISMRQATADDLFVLPSSKFIGTEAIPGNPQTVNGVAIPLEDKWVLTPEEQMDIRDATENFNAIIQAAATQAGFAFVDANMLLQELADGNVVSGDYQPSASLVTGGIFSLDGVHPTARGNAWVANQFMKAIDAQYGSNFEASGNLLDIGEYNTNYSAALQ